jgi:hypothetical protein
MAACASPASKTPALYTEERLDRPEYDLVRHCFGDFALVRGVHG